MGSLLEKSKKETSDMATQETLRTKDVRWDLSPLYSGIDDPAMESDIVQLIGMAGAFKTAYKGRLASELADALAAFMELNNVQHDLMVYLFLRSSLDQNDEAVKTKQASVQERLTAPLAEGLTFFEHEIVALSEEDIARQEQVSELLRKHRPWIDHIRVFKPHLLAETVEEALAKRGMFGPDSWATFFDEVEADLRFTFDDKQLTLTEILHAMTEERDGDRRAAMLKVVHEGLSGPFTKYAAQTLNMVVRAKAREDTERGYQHPMEARNKGSKIPDKVVEALHAAVTETAAPLAQRFYRLKAAHLGVDKLRWSDRNADIPFAADVVIPFDEAMTTVLSAYRSFSPTLGSIVERQLTEKRIDAPVYAGRGSGAYNYSFTSKRLGKPVSFTFLNYLGSARDVMTLAHELGHGAHGLLAGEAVGTLMQHAPMAYAETASVFGEMTTFTFLRKRLEEAGDKKALLGFLMGKIDDMLNTAVRQIGFSNFERKVHGAGRRLSPEELSAVWMETLQELYGKPGDVFTYEHVEHLWTYVSHFHRPFYVYAYAFGELLTQSLYAKRDAIGDRFEPLYLDLLRSGDTHDVVALMAPFGFDPTTIAFWRAGIEVSLGTLVAEAERLSAELGISAQV
jgi:oligoendopeptidase F